MKDFMDLLPGLLIVFGFLLLGGGAVVTSHARIAKWKRLGWTMIATGVIMLATAKIMLNNLLQGV